MQSQTLTHFCSIFCLTLAAACGSSDSASGEQEQSATQAGETEPTASAAELDATVDTDLTQGEPEADLAEGDQGLPGSGSAPDLALVSGLSEPAIAGGQSGGQSGSMFVDRACYCGFDQLAVAKVVNPNDRGFCAVFELMEKPAGVDDYHGLEPGDLFGGSGRILCRLGLDIEPDAVVYVQYTPGRHAAQGCDEYQVCENDCGSVSEFAANPETDPEGYAAEEAALVECRAACTGSTREACSEYAELARFTGEVVIAPRGENGEVLYTDQEGDTYAISDTAGLVDYLCEVESTLVSSGEPPEQVVVTTEDGEELDFYDAHPDTCDVP